MLIKHEVEKMKKKLYRMSVDFIHNKSFTVRASSEEEAIELATDEDRAYEEHQGHALGVDYVKNSIEEIAEEDAEDYGEVNEKGYYSS
jgi:NOL1/NOP2/fmu family ribosome biogenesis protein